MDSETDKLKDNKDVNILLKVDEVKVDEVKVDEVKVDELKVDELKVDEVKVKKKRGRKPGSKNKKKNQIVVEKVKKKRGRKPKNNITINNNPDFSSEKCDHIIQINNKELPISDLEGYNPEEYYKMNETIQNNTKCWNCCCDIINNSSIPIKYINNVFYTYGNFCSKECSVKYCFDNFNNDKYEIYSLINLYNFKENGSLTPIKPADSRYVLDIFGGPLTMEEYKENFKSLNYCNMTRIPIIHTNNSINTIDHNTNKNYNMNNYKIYRKEPVNNSINSITNIMKLQIN